MKISTKLKLKCVLLFWMQKKANRLGKKIKKFNDENKYPIAWRNNYIIKKSKKIAKNLKIKLDVEGFNNLPKPPFILTPNHSSSFDAALIILALENKDKSNDIPNLRPTFLAKKELENNKIFKGFANIINTYYIDRENIRDSIKVIDDMIAYVKEKRNVAVIFPEGTRSKDGRIGEFKGGAFRSAKKDFLPIVPVTINNALACVDFSRRKMLNVKIIFHPIIKPISLLTIDTNSIAKIVQKQVQSRWIKPTKKITNKEKELI